MESKPTRWKVKLCGELNEVDRPISADKLRSASWRAHICNLKHFVEERVWVVLCQGKTYPNAYLQQQSRFRNTATSPKIAQVSSAHCLYRNYNLDQTCVLSNTINIQELIQISRFSQRLVISLISTQDFPARKSMTTLKLSLWKQMWQ